MNLYELNENYNRLMMMLEDDEENVAIQDTLDSIDEAIEQKFENIEKWRRNLQVSIDGFKAEEERIKAKRQALEKRSACLKQYLQDFMFNTGRTKVNTDIFDFRIQKNPASVQVTELEKIPQEFLIPQDPKVDKTSIKAALKNGIFIPGVEMVQTEGLRVK